MHCYSFSTLPVALTGFCRSIAKMAKRKNASQPTPKADGPQQEDFSNAGECMVKLAQAEDTATSTTEKCARWLLAFLPGFPDWSKVDEHTVNSVNSALATHWTTSVRNTDYYVNRETGERSQSAECAKLKGWERMTAAIAVSYTGHEVGEIKKSGTSFAKAMHSLVSELRKACSTYVTKRKARAAQCASNLTNPVKATRDRAKPFGEKVELVLENLVTSSSNAVKRGDPTAAPKEVVEEAKAAFLKVLANHFAPK